MNKALFRIKKNLEEIPRFEYKKDLEEIRGYVKYNRELETYFDEYLELANGLENFFGLIEEIQGNLEALEDGWESFLGE